MLATHVPPSQSRIISGARWEMVPLRSHKTLYCEPLGPFGESPPLVSPTCFDGTQGRKEEGEALTHHWMKRVKVHWCIWILLLGRDLEQQGQTKDFLWASWINMLAPRRILILQSAHELESQIEGMKACPQQPVNHTVL